MVYDNRAVMHTKYHSTSWTPDSNNFLTRFGCACFLFCNMPHIVYPAGGTVPPTTWLGPGLWNLHPREVVASRFGQAPHAFRVLVGIVGSTSEVHGMPSFFISTASWNR